MSLLSKDEFDFDKIEISGEPLPPFADEVLTPEAEDPYWEIHYPGGMIIFLTGNVQVMAHSREELKVVEGGKREGLRKEVTELSSKKKEDLK